MRLAYGEASHSNSLSLTNKSPCRASQKLCSLLAWEITLSYTKKQRHFCSTSYKRAKYPDLQEHESNTAQPNAHQAPICTRALTCRHCRANDCLCHYISPFTSHQVQISKLCSTREGQFILEKLFNNWIKNIVLKPNAKHRHSSSTT